jgi:hypothetical protein
LCYRIYKAIFYWSVCCSKKTALLVIDNLTEGPNAVVTTWRDEMEELCKVVTQRLRRTMAVGGVPGYTFALDNVGYVKRSRHVDNKEKRSEYKKMAIVLAAKNRVATAHLT